MPDAIKTEYMNQPTRGYSEYVFRDDAARNAIAPNPGDRAIMKNGDIYFCWEPNIWEKIGA